MAVFNSMKKGIFLSIMALLFIFTIISCENDTTQPNSEVNGIAGVISDEASMSVPFAVVQLVDENATKLAKISGETILATDTTDEDGNFKLDNLPLDISTFTLRVMHPDFGVYNANMGSLMKDKDKKNLPVKILHDTNCTGRIEITVLKSKDSTAIAEVEVRMNRGSDVIRKSYTNSEGKIVFENVCPGTYWVRIARTGYRVIETDGWTVEGTSNIQRTFYMNQVEVDSCCFGQISVLARDINGALLSGVLMKLYKNGSLLNGYTSEEAGLITFRNLCPGTYQVKLFKYGFISQEIDIELGCSDTVNYERVLLQDSCCNGKFLLTLTDTSGAPAPGVTVLLRKMEVKLGEVKTNDNGQYLFTGLCEGTYSILASREGFKVLEYVFTIVCNDSLGIAKTMYPAEVDTCCEGKIKIFIMDDATRAAILGGTVKIWKNGVLLGSQPIENGYVLFTKLCTGKYGFDIIKDGYVHKEFAVELGCNQVLELEKAIVKETPKDTCCNGAIKVIVRDSRTKAALNGATVKLWFGDKLLRTGTVDGGYVYFKELCKGRYALDIIKEGYTHQEFVIELECNESKAVEKELVSNTADSCCKGQYTIYLLDSATGRPIKEAAVFLWKGSTKLRYLYSDADGKVTFTEMCEGEYSISVNRTGYYGREWAFRIGCNEILSTERKLLAKPVSDTCCTAVLKVNVIDSTETSIVEARVVVYKGDQAIADPRTNTEGWAIVEGLCYPPGRYTVVVSKDGYVTQEFVVEYTSCIVQKKVVVLRRP